MFPVVQSGTLDLPLVERKSKRFDEVERCPRSKAGSAGIAGIPVDLGVDEDDVNQPKLRLGIVEPGGFAPARRVCLTVRS
jgi:hypothetical protein